MSKRPTAVGLYIYINKEKKTWWNQGFYPMFDVKFNLQMIVA